MKKLILIFSLILVSCHPPYVNPQIRFVMDNMTGVMRDMGIHCRRQLESHNLECLQSKVFDNEYYRECFNREITEIRELITHNNGEFADQSIMSSCFLETYFNLPRAVFLQSYIKITTECRICW